MSTEATKISADSLSDESITRDDTSEPWPSPSRAWYAVFVFALALMINMLDRGIVPMLIRPLKRDLGLSDWDMGLLMGPIFVIFYMVLGLPIARLADYKSRRAILGVGVTVWSVMTSLCGVAQGFWQLCACRIGVGSGEACSGPATFSMLADLFPKEKLPRAIAVLNFGFYAGNGLALIISGILAQVFADSAPITLPLVGVTMRGWQMTFVIIGLPGLIVAALLATVREPKRRISAKLIPIRDVFAFLNKNRTSFAPIFIGMGIQVVMTYGALNWGPAFYMRTFGWTTKVYGLVMGPITIVIMPVGTLLGSILAERFARAGRDDANMRVVFLGKLAALPFGILFPFMPNAYLAVTVSTIGLFFLAWTAAPLNAALQFITPHQMRGQITALFLFVFNVIGFGLGPMLVAFFTHYVFQAESQVGLSLAATGLILGPLGTLVIWLGMKPYGRSVAEAKAWA
ncbi:MAG TPA: MFS transporter [Blastocatellia bacterium]|nr:MFS transporter [Blastocatellia bacterium]